MNTTTFFSSLARSCALWLIELAVAATPQIALSQTHGAGLFKNVAGPDGTGTAHAGDIVTATISVVNLDDFQDSITVTNIVDVVHHATGDVVSANLLMTPITLLEFGDSVTVTNSYLAQSGDIGLPSQSLLDTAIAAGRDNRDGSGGTGLPQNFQLTFPGQILLVVPKNHGAALVKTVLGPDGTANAHIGDVITATIRVKNLDDFQDSITLTSIVDVVHHAIGDVTSPNLLMAPVTLLNFGDSVTVTNSYLAQPGDASTPSRYLLDDARAAGRDNHDGPGGTAVPQSFFLSFPGEILVAPALAHGAGILKTVAGTNGTANAHVGEMVTAKISVVNLDEFRDSITLTSIVDVVHHSSGDVSSPNLLTGPVTLLGLGDSVFVTNSYLVQLGDTNLPSRALIDSAVASGVDNHDGAGGSLVGQGFQITFPGQISISKPSVTLIQDPANALGAESNVFYGGSVSNSGNTSLSGVVVSNFVNGAFAYVLGPISLGINQAIVFTNAFLPVPPAAPVPNTLFAAGTDPSGLTVFATLLLQIPQAPPPLPATYTFTTFAGSPRFGSADALGTAAQFNFPVGLAVDNTGNVFVADGNNTIRKITPDGQVSTIAGNAGTSGSADGTNGMARFSGPNSVALDSAGNLYVADGLNSTIRKIAPVGTNWVVTTIAGLAGVVGQANGLGGAALFELPLAVAVDGSNNVYVADGINTIIRKLTPLATNGVVTNWMVTTIPGFVGSLSSLTVDSIGILYVADADNHTVRKITQMGANWIVSTNAGLAGHPGVGDGTNSTARFNRPSSVAVDSSTNLYVTDTLNNTVRKITAVGSNSVVSTLAGSTNRVGSDDGTGTNALFSGPSGIAVDVSGNLFVADSQNGIIRQVTSAGVVSTIAGSISAGIANGNGNFARFNQPFGVAVDNAGDVYVADTTNATIRRITRAGLVTTVAGLAGSHGSIDGAGNNARFFAPAGVAVDNARNVYATDNNTIRRITPGGLVSTLAGSATNASGNRDGTNTIARFNNPLGIAVDTNGNIFVADSGNNTVRVIRQFGTNWSVSTIAGSTNSGSADGVGAHAQFSFPSAIAVDSAGDLFVADTANSTVRKITPFGTNWLVITIAGGTAHPGRADGTASAAGFNSPQGVAVDGSGNVYVADSLNDTIRIINQAGVVTTIGGVAGLHGSVDGAGNAARFFNPTGIAVDEAGDVYVADTINNTIRKGVFSGYTTAKAVAFPPSPMSGQLIVTMLPPEAKGQWRFPWELGWRTNGQAAINLADGDYPVEFRELPGWLTIPPSLPVVHVGSGGITPIATNVYYPTLIPAGTNSTSGSLTVNLGPTPPSGAGWRFLGDDNNPFPAYPSGYSTNLLAGTYLIEFAGPFTNRSTPPPLSVTVLAGQPTVISVNYLSAASKPNGVIFPTPVPANSNNDETVYPFGFNGQLQSEVGYGSGVAAQSNVVLTAAHLVFNDRTLSYASQVYWFSQMERGVSEPEPILARAFYLLDGYAAERTNDLASGYSPDQSTPPSRNLDVAAIYFPSQVAGGGYGGYLPSDAVPNSWLTSMSLKMLVGYPVDGSLFGDASIIAGKMYQTDPQPYPLILATDPVPGQQEIYLATWFLSYPGNSGGPLYVQYNGYYYPAGVYLGTLYSGNTPYASVVRAIDSNVVNLITVAQSDAGSGTNNNGGGVIPIIPDQTISAHNVGYVRLQLAPPAAVLAGAAWQFAGDASYSTGSNYTLTVASTNPVTIQFREIPGWSVPTNIPAVTVFPKTTATPMAFYTELPIRLSYRTSEGLRLFGSTGLVYRIESTTNLSLTNWITNSTLTLGNLTVTNNSQVIGGTTNNAPRRFFRAIRTP